MAGEPAEQPRAAPGNDDDDVDSDTTIEETNDDDSLWTVEDVLAEAPAAPGIRDEEFFLILWTGFGLYDATWEPKVHLEQPTIESWEETKAAIARGEKEEFDEAKWWQARFAHARARLDRARRRDAKRQKRGRSLSGNTAKMEEKLKEIEAEFNGDEASDFNGDESYDNGSDSDVNDAVLPPPRVIDLTASPPSARYQGSASRKPTNARRDTTGPAKKNRKGTGTAGPSTAGTSASTVQRSKQPPQQTPGGRKGAPLMRAASGIYGVPQPSRQTQPSRQMQPPRQTQPTTGPNRNVQLKATRTGATAGTKGAGGNIFIEGKAARERKRLLDVSKDTTKDPKFYTNRRIGNIAYKMSRAKEDRAPPTISARIFDISKGPSSGRPRETEGARQATVTGQERPSALVKRRTTDDEFRGAEDGTPRPAVKKRKSVTFCDMPPNTQSPPPIPDSSPQSEPMDIDEPDVTPEIDEPIDGLFVPWRPPSPVKVKSEGNDINPPFGPPLEHLSIGTNFQFTQSLTIKRVVDFGSWGARKLEVSLDGIPNTPGEQWFSDLTKGDEISFTHTCVAKNLTFQLDNIAGPKIGAGSIRSDTASEALENVASRLRLGSFGAVCFRDGYIIVVHPTRCNDWKAGVFAAAATSPSEVDLGYMLFKRGSDGNPPPGQVQPLEPPSDQPLGDRALVWQGMLGFDYKSLLPKDLGKGGVPGSIPHAFFLLFPPSKEAELDAMCLYLRSCDRQCLIYTNRDGGAWELIFMTKCCTIIVHESTTWALRRLRNVFSRIAIPTRFTFWRATTAMTAHSGIPLGDFERWVPPAKIGLHRLLPSGKAILLSPSFLLAQPSRAAQFLIWYSENIARTRHVRTNKIVVARGVCEYVRDIADQKWRSAGAPVKRWNGEASGASLDDCQATDTAWTSLRDLFELSESSCSWKDKDLAPIVCAPDDLGASDEQSLVNWFGWWSSMNLDAYRSFVVLGTDETDMGDGMATTTAIRLPTYHPDMIKDPFGGAHDIATQAEANHGEVGLPCQRLSNDNPKSMVDFFGCLALKTRKTIVILYKFPVGFSSLESRLASPHFHPQLELFQTWFRYLLPFSWLPVGGARLPSPLGGKMIYAGLFYTAMDDNDGYYDARQEGQFRRHPWLAFYRPSQPHLLSSAEKIDGHYDLIMWDWTTPARFPSGDDIIEDGLFAAQRQLIEFINQNTAKKNPGSILKNVFLGGPDPATLPAHPMDLTLEFLEVVMEDARNALPSTEDWMRAANFRKVISRSQAQAQAPEPASPAMAADKGAEGDVVYSDIFHPPRGNMTGQPSRCRNILSDQAQEAVRSRRVAKDGTFSYRFLPTTKWYEQQQKEGRAFEHMLVGKWKLGFDLLGIGKEGKGGGSAGTGSPGSLA